MADLTRVAQMLRAEIVKTVGECVCDEGYTSRNLIDPSCGWHEVDGDHLPDEMAQTLATAGLLATDTEWGVQYERQLDPTMDNPSGVVTVVQTVASAAIMRAAIHNRVPVSARNRRPVRREVTPWRLADETARDGAQS